MGFEYTFEDNSKAIASAIERAVAAGLEEVGGEVVSQARRNSRTDTGDTKRSFQHRVVGNTVYVGSDAENALWEEFGTGTYAENGGKSGYWVFVKGAGGKGRSSGRSYTLEEAKQVMAILRSKGLEAYYTNGKKPTKALSKAFAAKAPVAKKIMESKLGAIG